MEIKTYEGIAEHATGLIPAPAGPGRLDQMRYRSVHFFGPCLSEPLAEAAEFLLERDKSAGRPTHVLCLHAEVSAESNSSGGQAWRVTLVFSDPGTDRPTPGAATEKVPDSVPG